MLIYPFWVIIATTASPWMVIICHHIIFVVLGNKWTNGKQIIQLFSGDTHHEPTRFSHELVIDYHELYEFIKEISQLSITADQLHKTNQPTFNHS